MKIRKVDVIGIGQGYLGCAFFTWWGIWSENVYGLPLLDISGFLTSVGGLI